MKLVFTRTFEDGKLAFDKEITGLPLNMKQEELQAVADLINRFARRDYENYWVATDDYVIRVEVAPADARFTGMKPEIAMPYGGEAPVIPQPTPEQARAAKGSS